MSSHSSLEGKYIFNKREIADFVSSVYGVVPTALSPISSGIMNTTVKIRNADGSMYALRIYRRSANRARIAKELSFSRVLKDDGVPVPAVRIDAKGRGITSLSSKSGTFLVVMFEFLKGNHLTKNRTDLIPQVATIHARMHRVGIESRETHSHSITGIMRWLDAEYQTALEKIKCSTGSERVEMQLRDMYADLRAEYKRLGEQIHALPFAISHLDFDSSNILCEGNTITGVIDFDDIDDVPAVLDLGFSLWWWCFYNFKVRDSVLEKYLASYCHVRELSLQEKAFIALFMRIRNCILTCLLFINLPVEPRASLVRRGIQFDVWLKKKHQ